MYQGMNLIDGRWTDFNDRFKTINPSDEEVIGNFPQSPAEQVDKAVKAARKAFKSWSKVSRVKRSDYLFKLCALIERDQTKIAKIISIETGKSLNESNAEVVEAIHMCQVAAGSGRTACGEWMASEISEKDAYVMRKPKGVVGVITPWNFPFAICFWTSAPALVEGNCVVHKPSELTPYTGQMVAELYKEVGLPDGVFNLVHGEGAVTGDALIKHPDVNCILFTGSYRVGQLVRMACAETFNKSCSCETGSKSATIVFADANPKLAMDLAFASAFKLTGQRCVSSGRILIQRDIYNKFCEEFADRASKLTVGDPFGSPAPYCGPLISKKQWKRVIEYNDMVMDEVMLRGIPLDRPGFFLTPHVYKSEWADKPYLKEEVFGPHVALVPFNDTEDAIRIYNDTNYGLALGIVTDDFRRMRKMRDECHAGMIYLNGGSVAAESHLPFGGVKMSGNGYKSAAGTYKAVTDEVAVTVNYEEGITWAQGMK